MFKEIYRLDNPCCQRCTKTYESGEQPKAHGFSRLANYTAKRETQEAMMASNEGFRTIDEGASTDDEC